MTYRFLFCRFALNLTCGRGPTSDVAFHLNPRLLQHYIVRNTRLNGQWGDEEKTSTVKFPLQREGKFNLCIFIGNGEFLVNIEGTHFCTYKFRVPLNKLTGIDIQVLILFGVFFFFEEFINVCRVLLMSWGLTTSNCKFIPKSVPERYLKSTWDVKRLILLKLEW